MSTTNRRQSTPEQQVFELLKQLGLSEREIEVFFEVLRSDKVSAADIGHRLKDIPRTSIYDITESLVSRGLVNTVTEGGKTLYQPQGVERIVDSLEVQKQEITEKQNQIRGIADIFAQIKSGSLYKPQVRFFEGKAGVLAVHRELQNARKPADTIVDIQSVAKFFPRMMFDDNLKDFQSNKLLKRDLMIKSKEAISYLRSAPLSEYHRLKWLPESISFQTDTLIWEGHVAIIDYSDALSAVILDNPTIQKTFTTWFEMMWQGVEKEVVPKDLK